MNAALPFSIPLPSVGADYMLLDGRRLRSGSRHRGDLRCPDQLASCGVDRQPECLRREKNRLTVAANAAGSAATLRLARRRRGVYHR